jgi:hypothetical protein
MRTPSASRRTWVAIGVAAAVAAVVRLAPSIASGALVNAIEYDGGVVFAAALSFLAGQAPYGDFIYLYPPGSIILFSPAALLAGAIGEPNALAVVRAGIAVVGVANVILIGALLRRRGVAHVVVGAGLYAVWPVVTFTERLVMLEPLMNLLLLGSLLLVSSRQRPTLIWLAGGLLGVALTIKYWAIVDIVLVGLVVVARGGGRAFWRYVAGVALAAGAIALPFFALDPSGMWQQTVTTQLTRPGSTGVAERVNMLSAFWTTPSLDNVIPWQLWAVGAASLLMIAVLPLVGALRQKARPRDWTDPTWWGIIVWAHAGVMVASGVFYNHYAAWVIAPLCLTTGAAVSAFRGRRTQRIFAATAAALLIVVAIPQLRPVEVVPDRHALQAWARDAECLWGDAATLVAADAVRRDLDAGCDVAVDVFGTGLVLFARDTGRGEKVIRSVALGSELREQLERSDRALLPPDPSAWPFDQATSDWFQREFRSFGITDGLELWVRNES